MAYSLSICCSTIFSFGTIFSELVQNILNWYKIFCTSLIYSVLVQKQIVPQCKLNYNIYIYSSKYNEAVKCHSYHDYIQTSDLRNELLIGTFWNQNITVVKKIAMPH